MARGIVRLGDFSSGYLCYIPTVAISGSSNTFVNNRRVVRQLDLFAPHFCKGKISQSFVMTASTNTFVNGRGVARRLDSLSKFPGIHLIISASNNTFCN
jgi:uncharacterized Zn-binding protein involved in type VI secretion